MPDELIIRESSSFYSYLDEESFFRWLESIPAVTDVVRVGRDLRISLKLPFADPSNESWFKDPGAYWHYEVFGDSDSGNVHDTSTH
jgi:hypothetical protein